MQNQGDMVEGPAIEIPSTVKAHTNEFLEMLFPPLQAILRSVERPEENAIIQKHLLLYAKQGQGKTETANWLVAEAIRRYGKPNVSSFSVKGENFRHLLSYGFSDVPINILVAEDITDVQMRKEEVRDFFRIRHVMRERTGRQNGYVLVIFTGHRFHDIPVALRTDVDFILFRESPSNDYDYHFVRSFIGDYGLRLLSQLEPLRDLEPRYKGFAFLTAKRRRIGLIYAPKEKTFHIGRLVVTHVQRARNPLHTGNPFSDTPGIIIMRALIALIALIVTVFKWIGYATLGILGLWLIAWMLGIR